MLGWGFITSGYLGSGPLTAVLVPVLAASATIVTVSLAPSIPLIPAAMAVSTVALGPSYFETSDGVLAPATAQVRTVRLTNSLTLYVGPATATIQTTSLAAPAGALISPTVLAIATASLGHASEWPLAQALSTVVTRPLIAMPTVATLHAAATVVTNPPVFDTIGAPLSPAIVSLVTRPVSYTLSGFSIQPAAAQVVTAAVGLGFGRDTPLYTQAVASLITHPIGGFAESITLTPARATASTRSLISFDGAFGLTPASCTVSINPVIVEELKTFGIDPARAAIATQALGYSATLPAVSPLAMTLVTHAPGVGSPWVSQASVALTTHVIGNFITFGDFNIDTRVWIGRYTSVKTWKVKELGQGVYHVPALKDETVDLGETWNIFAFLNDANGLPIPNIGACTVEWMVGDPKTNRRLLDATFLNYITVIDAPSAKIGIQIQPSVQTVASLVAGDFKHFLKVTQPNGTVSHEVEGRFRIRPNPFTQYT